MNRISALTDSATNLIGTVAPPAHAEWRSHGYHEHRSGIGPGAAIGLGVGAAILGAALLSALPRIYYPPSVYLDPGYYR